MSILKSSRHSKIAGDFAEALLLYWLSRDNFECTRVDHTGIDLIARNRYTNELMGISVKCRSRSVGTERGAVNLPRDGFVKARLACEAFGCVPFYAIVIDDGEIIRAYILSLKHLESIETTNGANAYWRMDSKSLDRYARNPEIRGFELRVAKSSWWQSAP